MYRSFENITQGFSSFLYKNYKKVSHKHTLSFYDRLKVKFLRHYGIFTSKITIFPQTILDITYFVTIKKKIEN